MFDPNAPTYESLQFGDPSLLDSPRGTARDILAEVFIAQLYDSLINKSVLFGDEGDNYLDQARYSALHPTDHMQSAEFNPFSDHPVDALGLTAPRGGKAGVGPFGKGNFGEDDDTDIMPVAAYGSDFPDIVGGIPENELFEANKVLENSSGPTIDSITAGRYAGGASEFFGNDILTQLRRLVRRS